MHADEHRNEQWQWVGPALRRVRLRNYRCLERCDVALAPLSVVVGRNGAGKSAFLDALAFAADAVRGSVRRALAARGGLEAVRRRSTGHPRHLGLDLELRLPSWHLARYGFELAVSADGGFAIRYERAELRDADDHVLAFYQRDRERVVRSSLEAVPPPLRDHLLLPRAAGLGVFRELHDALAAIVAYRFDPEVLRAPGPADDGAAALAPDGRGLASVVARLARERPAELARIAAYLGAIAPGLIGLERVSAGAGETVLFRQAVAGAQHPWRFHAADMSDGTLRALAVLVAAFQDVDRRGALNLALLEAPETGLHPAAIPVLVEALRDAARRTQLVIASHSPELVDALRPGRDALLVATVDEGTAEVAAVADAAWPAPAVDREASGVKNGEAEAAESAGARLRRDRLAPARNAVRHVDQLDLFGAE